MKDNIQLYICQAFRCTNPPVILYYGEMIAYIEGSVIRTENQYIVILANGVGYKVYSTESMIQSAAKDTKISVHTYLAVRENSMDIYGFNTTEELQFFELLISVSGIGPKSALGILDIADIATLKTAITHNDSSYLTKVSGIGTKSAKKIVLELQDKIDGISVEESSIRKDDMDVFEALKALGYSPYEVRSVLRDIPDTITETPGRIKEALKRLGS